MTISTVLEQDPFLLMYELCGKNQHLIYIICSLGPRPSPLRARFDLRGR